MLVPWRPFVEPFDEFDKFFDKNQNPAGFSPAVDIYEKGKDLIVETTLVGLDPENLEISIENDILTMQGKMEKKSEVDEKNYYRREIRTGSFYRQIPLPLRVLGDKATAVFEAGVLKVKVPKASEQKQNKIEVKIVRK